MKKQTKKGWALLMVALFLGLGVSFVLFHCDNKYTAALSGGYGYNVLQEDSQNAAFLVDGWEYYPGQLLAPEDFAAGVTPERYTYIGEHPNFSQDSGSPYGVATYRIILKNGGQPKELALYLPELLCAGRIYINGALVGEQGSVEPYEPRVMDGVYGFFLDENVEIIVQCANYSHYYSGMYYPPAVGSPSAISRMLTVKQMVYGILCFASLAIALSYLGQWLLGRDKLTRYMGVLSLAFALRVAYPFIRALGAPSVRLLYGLEDVCANVVLLCAILLAGELSGAAVRRYHRRIAVPGAAGLCVFTAVFPICILPYVPGFINVYGLVLFLWKLLAGIYLIVLAGRSLKVNRPLGHYYLFAAGLYGLWVAASVVTANRFEPICGAWLEEYGGFALVLGFAAMMVHRGALIARENRRLNLHLQEEVDRKTGELERLLAERKELLASLLHDLKNPLAAVQSYATLAKSSGVALDQETAGYLDALTERAETMGDRFSLLQEFSRGERGALPMERVCLNVFLKQFYDSNRPDMELSGLDFELKLPRENLEVNANSERLWVALENLCYNALSFTPEDGNVTLELAREDGNARITVRDTGKGIAPEQLPHVFEPGFTRRPDGSGEGLGLYIVRTVALEHGGGVEVHSRLGQGSAFIVRLPLLKQKQ